MNSSSRYNLVNIFAVLSIFGFWGMHSVLYALGSGANTAASVAYRAFQLGYAFVVIIACLGELSKALKRGFFLLLAIILLFYSGRMLIDMYMGPFTAQLPHNVFVNDFLFIVGSVFSGAFALIAGYKYLNINFIAKLTFLVGVTATILLFYSLFLKGNLLTFEDDRLDLGGGLGSLALVKLGAVTFLAGMHLFINKLFNKVLLILSMILTLFLSMASGARGGLVSLVIVLIIYTFIRNRTSLLLSLVTIILFILFVVNIVPILTWLSDFFPVIGERLLLTVVEGDEGNRELLRQKVYGLLLENPLTGFSYRMSTDITGYTTHNGILDVCLALGVPMGIVFLVTYYINLGFKALKKMSDKTSFFATAMFVYVLVASFTGSSVTDNIFDFSTCLFISSYYSACSRKHKVYAGNMERATPQIV